MSKFLEDVKKNSLTILALTISVFTLFMYVRQTNILVQQTKASSWPYLVVNRSLNLSFDKKTNSEAIDSLYIYVANKGTGPAIIEKVVVRINGEEISNWGEFYKVISVPDSIQILHYDNILHEEVVMPGEIIVPIKWYGNNDLVNYVYDRFDDLEIAICYRSIHDDYWTITKNNFTRFDNTIRIQSKHCQLEAKTYFTQ